MYLSLKAWSQRARESALRVRKGGTAIGADPNAGTLKDPKIQARVKEILAANAEKGKKKGKGGKAKGKGKGSADAAKKKADAAAKKAEREKAKAERAKAAEAKKQERAKAKVAADMAKAGKQAASAEAKKQAQAAREQKQAERAKAVAEKKKAVDKKHKAVQKARDKAKADKDKERQAKQDQTDADTKQAVMGALEKWRKVREIQKAGKSMDDLAIKAGARHSSADMKHLQAIHDSSVACGALCGPESDDSGEGDMQTDDDAAKAIKSMMDDPGYYASHECGDIMQASQALANLAMLIQSELAEEDEDTQHIEMLCEAAHTLVDFIGSELDELEQAAKDDAQEDATIGHEPMKAITAREDVNPKEGIAEYGKVEFADAKNKRYPVDTEAHVRSAWSYINQEKNAAKYAADEVAQIKAKIVAAWKKLIDKAGPPSAGKALDMIHVAGGAIKALGDGDEIGGYAVLFGDADNPDIERDFYTKATNFWLDDFGWPRPITYHHGMDAGTRDNPVIGHWTKAAVDDTGVWLTGQLDRAHAYYKAIKELAQRGYLKLSSDSAPQWVMREKQPNGANFVKRWPLVTASATVTPMEPRMLPVEVKAFLAELGFDAIDDSQEAVNPDAALDAAKAADDERARRLLLELDLLQLEWESASA